MKINKLWVLPVLSSEVDKISFLYDGISIIITGYNEKDGEKFKLLFNKVKCYKHTDERFTKDYYNCYDTLVEVEDSEWIKELKQLNEEDFNYWKPKHFAIYLDSVGLFEIISNNFVITND